MRRQLSHRAALMVLATLLVVGLHTHGFTPWDLIQDQAEARTAKEQQKRKEGQDRRKPEAPEAAPVTSEPPNTEAQPAPATAATASPLRERVEADVSTRSIAVTSGFRGTEIIVFGSVDNSRQPSAEAGYYDVVVVVEGLPTPLVARKKSNVAGLWINTDAAAFVSVPSYYAIASTRPLEEIADAELRQQNAIGFDYVRLTPSAQLEREVSAAELEAYKAAVIRLKEKGQLYIKDDYGVAFIGRSLFRSSVELSENVPVGTLTARVYLFREGELLSTFATRVRLEREGIELLLYRFAARHSLLYGIFAVTVAIAAGLLPSTLFRRSAR
jgi:uncharacterized protein (TIGR02186 family)